MVFKKGKNSTDILPKSRKTEMMKDRSIGTNHNKVLSITEYLTTRKHIQNIFIFKHANKILSYVRQNSNMLSFPLVGSKGTVLYQKVRFEFRIKQIDTLKIFRKYIIYENTTVYNLIRYRIISFSAIFIFYI